MPYRLAIAQSPIWHRISQRQVVLYTIAVHNASTFFIFFKFYVTVQPKKDKSIIHELAQCIIDLFFGAE